MGVKPSVDGDWPTIEIHGGSVGEFYNHESVTTDVVGMHWKGGNVPDNMTDRLAFRATLPKIEPASCVGTIVVQIASVQFCPEGHLNGWIKEKTSKWNTDEITSAGYAASFNIVRDLKNNPVTTVACDKNGKGLANLNLSDLETVTVYPDAADIDAHLDPAYTPELITEQDRRLNEICMLMGKNKQKAVAKCLKKARKFGMMEDETDTSDGDHGSHGGH